MDGLDGNPLDGSPYIALSTLTLGSRLIFLAYRCSIIVACGC